MPDLEISSAGTRAVIGQPIHKSAALVLEGLGGNPHSFAARQLTPRIAASADLIVAMAKTHREAILELAPQKLQRTFTLVELGRLTSEFGALTVPDLAPLRSNIASSDMLDIPDPIGREQEVFEIVGSRIAGLLPPVIELCRRSIAYGAS